MIKNIFVLASGSGSNFEALIHEVNRINNNDNNDNNDSNDRTNKFKILGLICNKENVKCLDIANKNNITNKVIKFNRGPNFKKLSPICKQFFRDLYEKSIIKYINSIVNINSLIYNKNRDCKNFKNINNNKLDYILCLGWMHILGKNFINYFTSRGIKILNLHPSLPGDNYLIGMNSIDRAWQQYLEHDRTNTGVMIHNVIPEVDKGIPIIWKSILIPDNYKKYILKFNLEEKKLVCDLLNLL